MQLTAGSALLEACVLAHLAKGDTYGYALTQAVTDVISISESTLYPVLRRLQKEGYLTTYDQPVNGRNRRYYAISPKGQTLLVDFKDEWQKYSAKINHILGGEV